MAYWMQRPIYRPPGQRLFGAACASCIDAGVHRERPARLLTYSGVIGRECASACWTAGQLLHAPANAVCGMMNTEQSAIAPTSAVAFIAFPFSQTA